jgi:hypothetical protein
LGVGRLRKSIYFNQVRVSLIEAKR